MDVLLNNEEYKKSFKTPDEMATRLKEWVSAFEINLNGHKQNLTTENCDKEYEQEMIDYYSNLIESYNNQIEKLTKEVLIKRTDLSLMLTILTDYHKNFDIDGEISEWDDKVNKLYWTIKRLM